MTSYPSFDNDYGFLRHFPPKLTCTHNRRFFLEITGINIRIFSNITLFMLSKLFRSTLYSVENFSDLPCIWNGVCGVVWEWDSLISNSILLALGFGRTCDPVFGTTFAQDIKKRDSQTLSNLHDEWNGRWIQRAKPLKFVVSIAMSSTCVTWTMAFLPISPTMHPRVWIISHFKRTTMTMNATFKSNYLPPIIRLGKQIDTDC